MFLASKGRSHLFDRSANRDRIPHRAIVVLGMHRSGTSALTRGLKALGVYLGGDYIGTRPDNPTGYWESKTIFNLNERLLSALGLKWDDVSLLDDFWWQSARIRVIHSQAIKDLHVRFGTRHLWGFKDPRTIRLLPFWRTVFHDIRVDDSYVVVLRNPLSVARSLLERNGIKPAKAYLLWLVHFVPYFKELAHVPFVVTDYDEVVADPGRQLERIGHVLDIPLQSHNKTIKSFADHFLDPSLRHTFFSEDDLDSDPSVITLIREAYSWLHQLATDRIGPNSPRLWSKWEDIQSDLYKLMPTLIVQASLMR